MNGFAQLWSKLSSFAVSNLTRGARPVHRANHLDMPYFYRFEVLRNSFTRALCIADWAQDPDRQRCGSLRAMADTRTYPVADSIWWRG